MEKILLLILPGYIFETFRRKAVAIPPKEEQWPFLLRLSLASFCIILGVRLACFVILKGTGFSTDVDAHRPVWNIFLPFEFSATLFWSCVLAFAAARLWPPKKDDATLDPVLRLLFQLIDTKSKNFAIVGLKSEKYYVGKILDATFSAGTYENALMIAPIMSGSRRVIKLEHETDPANEGSKRLVFDTYYFEPTRPWQAESNPKFIVPFREIVTLAEFDPEFHRLCLNRGTTVQLKPPAFDQKQKNSKG